MKALLRHGVAISASLLLWGGSEAVEITKDWVIAVPDDGAPAVRRAMSIVAQELRRDILEARGFDLPVVGADVAKSPAVRLGAAAAERAGVCPVDLDGLENVYAEKDGVWRTLVRIPFAALGVGRLASGDRWCLNIGREWNFNSRLPYECALWNPNVETSQMCEANAMGFLLFE